MADATTPKKPRRHRLIRAWGGFVDGRLDAGFVLGTRTEISPIFGVFRTRKAARALYADVRRVLIEEGSHADPKLVVLADLRELEDDCEKNKPREYGDDSWTAWAADVARRAQAELMSASQPSAPVDRQAVRHYLTCHQCEKKVSTLFTPEPTKTPDGGLIVRAWIECPECIEKDVAESEADVTALHAERDRLAEQLADANKQREAFAAKYIEAIERLEKTPMDRPSDPARLR